MPNELTAMFNPIALTHAVNAIKTERLFLSEKLGSKAPISHATEQALFDLVTGTYKILPIGHPGDPATVVHRGDTIETKTVTPPQVFVKDPIPASVINGLRAAGQSPIQEGDGANAIKRAFSEMLGRKQVILLKDLDRTLEYLWSLALTTGQINYTNPLTHRSFAIDFSVSDACRFTAATLWDDTDIAVDPVFQIRQWVRLYQKLNGFAPDTFILGEDAVDALFSNEKLVAWLQSAGAVIAQANIGVGRDLISPVMTIPGIGTFYEYAGVYDADDGTPNTPYIPPKHLFMTSSRAWQLHYGAIYDFDIGGNNMYMGKLFSKMKIGDDGKTLFLFVESHPLPVLERNTGVVDVTVCS